MFEQDLDNIHKYSSDVIVTGSKKFKVDASDED